MDRAHSRLVLALAASASLHGWLAIADYPGARRVSSAGGVPLNVTLPASAIDYTAPTVEVPRVRALVQRQSAEAVHVNAMASYAARPTAVPRAGQPRGEPATGGSETYTQPSDPIYYTARSLDLYPKALTALDLDVPPGSAKVRATVFIDESGSVNDVRSVVAANADIEEAARELLLRTRFTPASKDGRVVKAQVLVSLE